MKTGKKVRNDLILIFAVLCVALLGILYLYVFRGEGDTVRVLVDGKLYGEYPLSKNLSEDIHTGDDHINRLAIKDGKAYMESATCPDGICVDHAPIFRDGESIVCLPHGVVVTVITDEGESPDIVV